MNRNPYQWPKSENGQAAEGRAMNYASSRHERRLQPHWVEPTPPRGKPRNFVSQWAREMVALVRKYRTVRTLE